VNVNAGNTTDTHPVNTAYAPPITVINSDSCKFANSVGGQGMLFGFSFGIQSSDEVCERLKLSRELRASGHNDVADELLKQDDRVAKAFEVVANKPAARVMLRNNEFEGRTLLEVHKAQLF
jgi:hypothetical protein